MLTNDQIIDKIRKLFAIAHADDGPQAANAMAHAQRLIAKYRLERVRFDIVDDEAIQLWNDEPLDRAPTIPPWRQAVGGAIAELNDCLCLVSDQRRGRDRVMVIAGRRTDFELAAAMYGWIVDTIDRLALEHGRRSGPAGASRRWLHSFRTGAGAEVEHRLLQEHRDRQLQLAQDPKAETALAIRHDAVRKWAEEHLDAREPKGRDPDIDSSAYQLGARVGRAMALRREDAGDDGVPALSTHQDPSVEASLERMRARARRLRRRAGGK